MPVSKTAFAIPKTGDQGFGRPQQLGGGRLEITLPDEWTLTRGELDMSKGEMVIRLKNKAGQEERFQIGQYVNQEIAWIKYPKILEDKWSMV